MKTLVMKNFQFRNYKSFLFTDFSATQLNASASWPSAVMELPLLDMDSDACKYTTCPVEKGVEQTYKYDLLIANYFPRAEYKVRYKLFNASNKDETCCILFNIKIIR